MTRKMKKNIAVCAVAALIFISASVSSAPGGKDGTDAYAEQTQAAGGAGSSIMGIPGYNTDSNMADGTSQVESSMGQNENMQEDIAPGTLTALEEYLIENVQAYASEKETVPQTTANPEYEGLETCYIMPYGTKYHTGECSLIDSSATEVPLADALAQGYYKCGRCHESE